MLEINNLTKTIKKKVIIDDLSLSLDNGIYGLLGPNGAGKTTLIRCITGLYSYQKGTIILNNKNLKNTSCADIIGYLPQNFGLLKEMTLKNMLLFFAGIKGMKEQEALQRIEECLELVNLSERKDSKVKELSGGMLRRAGIAQAIMNNPRLLILDEPSTGLDPEERIRFKSIIKNLEKECITIISTHIVDDVDMICDKVLVMNSGKIVFNDNCEALKKRAGKVENADVSSDLEKGYICVLKDI